MPSQTSSTVTNVTEQSFNWYELCNGTLGTDHGNPVNTAVTTHQVNKTWVRTPNFRHLVRTKARLPEHPFDYSRGSQTAVPTVYEQRFSASCVGQSGWSGKEVLLRYTLHPCRYIGIDSGERLLTPYGCIARLLERARGAEWQTPVFFAEARQTGDLILGTAQTIARTYSNLRRGNLVGAMRTLGLGQPSASERRSFNRNFGRDARRAAANRWLELQYGWIPLLSDAKNAAETLAEIVTDSASTVGRVTSRTRLETGKIDPNYQVEVSPPGFTSLVRYQVETYRAVWKFQPKGLNNLGSLGLTNPASVAWELVPLSFVVDWFLPIGRYLEQLDTSWRFEHVGGTLGYRREVHTEHTRFRRNGLQGTGSHTSSSLLVERRLFNGVPSLGLESIWFEPNIGASRVASGLALASQVFR